MESKSNVDCKCKLNLAKFSLLLVLLYDYYMGLNIASISSTT